MKPFLVSGIDPGTNRIGYALLRGGSAPELILAETISIPSGQDPAKRLRVLADAIGERLRRDKPDTVALEKLYFSKNAKTALSVAEARGIILLTAEGLVPSICEYAPIAVKIAVAGYGRADKSHVYRALKLLLPNARLPSGDDAIDAIAIAITALSSQRIA